MAGRKEVQPFLRGVLIDSAIPGKNGQFGGTGVTADWDQVARIKDPLTALGLPLILAGGLTPENVQAAIVATGTDGVDVAGGVEISPGIKNLAAMAQFVKNATFKAGSNGED